MSSAAPTLPKIQLKQQSGYRLVNSKYPPIAVFDDVADAADFEALFALQAMTNPRLLTELGQLQLLRASEIPYGITGLSYALAPFTHINPMGSRFSDGQYGVLYLADSMATALKEVAYHQQCYWSGVTGLTFERFVFRGLNCQFGPTSLHDACSLQIDHPIYHPNDYSAGRALGKKLRKANAIGLQYHSVRQKGAICWALFTPAPVTKIVQSAHFEMLWDGDKITATHKLIRQD
ncbi:MAG: RES family NAD+ phosphorylase [Alkalimonas sp.]|nr:RES family NAD+ phosphorylase [Alkalimonas sp.]